MRSKTLSLFLLAFLLPLPSEAYVVATDKSGNPLKWSAPGELRFVLYLPEGDTAALPPRDDLVLAIEKAAETWSTVNGSGVSIEIEIAEAGRPRPRAGYDRENPSANVNSILFETDVWRHEPGAFAVTLRTYGSRSGNLLHADIVFNAVEHRWAALEGRTRPDPDYRGPVDVQGVVTHEIGHALGFEHTDTVPSAMRPTVGYGEVWMRDLSLSDMEGLTSLYPDEITGQDFDDIVFGGCDVGSRGKPRRSLWSLFIVSATVGIGALRYRGINQCAPIR